MNRIKVTICGKEYSLKTAENASYVLNLAAELESKINNMVNSGNGVSVQTAAILIALSDMDDANKANQSVDNIRTQIKQYVDEAAKAMLEGCCLNSSDSTRSRNITGVVSLFGTSIPMAAFPGIGASIRISAAARFNLISSESPTILLTFTPISG